MGHVQPVYAFGGGGVGAPAGGVLHANLDVTLAADGVNVEAVVHGCDYIAEHGGSCTYSIDSLSVVEGKSTATGTQFQCIDQKECHKLN